MNQIDFVQPDLRPKPTFPVPLFDSYNERNVRADKMVITKEIAEMLLTRNTNNRPIQDYRVEEYRGRIERQEWLLNGETIKVAWDGQLLDGQKRLLAVCASGLSIYTWVVWGLDHPSQDTVDDGQKRTTANVLHMKGFTDTNRMAAIIGTIYRYNTGNPINDTRLARPTAQQAVDFARQHEHLLYSALTHGSMLANRIPVVLTAASAAWYLMADVNPGDLDDFWTRLQTGEHQTAHDPVWVLRERLIAGVKLVGGNKGKIPPNLALALILKAFRYHVAGKPIRQLKYDVDKEPFPLVALPLGELTTTENTDENVLTED